ncbi:VirB4 family type IV secretion system protein [Longirhabdus pacifica]|uniref:VirB4 family type IV secretion system protein n=1 Tax=Longirhabdus pacifica TaxID=2305227 RepID=UPI001008DE2C|nr:DUF87 domain-containing protein [Longirhabdus pacifica]
MLKWLKSKPKKKQTYEIDRQPKQEMFQDPMLIQRGMKEKKDYMAPHPVNFKALTYRKVGEYYIQTLFVFGWPTILQHNHLEDLYHINVNTVINYHVVPVNNKFFIRFLNKRIDDNNKAIRFLEKRKKSDGYKEAQVKRDTELRDKLIDEKENSYVLSAYIDVHATTLEKLEKEVSKVQRLLGRKGMKAYNCDGQNEQAFYATLPLLMDQLGKVQDFTTSNIADLFPLSSSSLSMNSGIYYGQNKGDDSMILLDRFKMKNPNAAIIAPSGSGKSTFAKQEHFSYWLRGAKVYIIDRDNETKAITKEVGGLFLDFSKRSDLRINPCDLRCNEEDKYDYFDRKVDFLINLYRKMAGNITTKERSLIARCIRAAYEEKGFTEDYNTLYEAVQKDAGSIKIKNRKLRPLTDMPTLSDIDRQMKEYESLENLRDEVAFFIEEGPGKIINTHSNVDITEYEWVSFGVRNLSNETRPVILWIVLDFIENAIKGNQDLSAHLREQIMVYAEEAWSIINNDEEAEYFYEYSKRCRKYGGALTTVWQNIMDCLKDANGFGIEILNNTSMVVVLTVGQKPVGIEELKNELGLNDKIIDDLKVADKGEGYIITDKNSAEFKLEIIPEIKHLVTASAFDEAS